MPEPGLPESFNVLMHELKGLGLTFRRINKFKVLVSSLSGVYS
jgi:DNA-directed RNA polymerase beta subunit